MIRLDFLDTKGRVIELEKKLAEILAQAEGGPINYQGKNVTLSYKIPIVKGQELEIEILRDNLKYKQGIALSVDRRKGCIEINGQELKSPIFWTSTAPKKFSFKCVSQGEKGIVNIWNIWSNLSHPEETDAWIGNAGLYVEHPSAKELVFHCSSGVGDVNFDDLIFKVLLG